MKAGPFTMSLRQSGGPFTVEDVRRTAQRRLPRAVWAYLEYGSDDERTLRANLDAWCAWQFRQRILAGLDEVELSTSVAGVELVAPVVLAPVGLAGAFRGLGDLAAAHAAERVGTRLVLSTGSTHSMEEVAAGAGANHWFQLYPWGDRKLTGSLIDRATDAGFHALFVTVDVPVVGNRLGERRHGMSVQPRVSALSAMDAARHPRWLADFARHRRITLANLAEPGTRGRVEDTVRRQAVNMRTDLSWRDLEWVRQRWPGPLFVKGVLDAEDAHRAVEVGAQGLVVSNHGGRQLNPARPTAEVLPEIVARVGERTEVLVDGGVRTGSDVAVALALGARAVLVGRPWVYGLAAAGQAGVEAVLDILIDELRRTMHLVGVADVKDFGPDVISAGVTSTKPMPLSGTHHAQVR